jgi:monoamine oxidase
MSAKRKKHSQTRYSGMKKMLQAISNQLGAMILVRADMSDAVRKQLVTVKTWADKENFYEKEN